MTADLDLLPRTGTFNVGAIRDWLDARIDAFEDPQEPNKYIIKGIPTETAYEARRQGGRMPAGAYVFVAAARVRIRQEEYAGVHEQRSAMEFVTWLFDAQACEVHEIGSRRDLTAQARDRGVPNLYDEDVRQTLPLWAGKLIRVGFFWELDHGVELPFAVSLETARRPEPIPEEPGLIRYLESGQLYERAATSTRDWFDDDGLDIGPPHLLTDGLYVWPADLAYYVRTYHVHLPRAFVVHAQRNHWTPPAVDVASLPELAF